MDLKQFLLEFKNILTEIKNENYQIDLSDINLLKETYLELIETFGVDDFELLTRISDEIHEAFSKLDEHSFEVHDDGIEVANEDIYLQIEKIITLLVNLIKIIKGIDLDDKVDTQTELDKEADTGEDNTQTENPEEETDEYDISFEKFMEVFKSLTDEDIQDIKDILEFFFLFKNTVNENKDELKKVFEETVANKDTIIEETSTVENSEVNEEISTDEVEKVIEEAKENIEIIKPDVEVDTTPWIKINKESLKKELLTLYNEKKFGNIEEVIDEVFGLVRCYDDTKCWKYPHHILKDNKVILNINGLRTAVLFFIRVLSTGNHDYTKEEIKKLAQHFARHYEELNKDIPSSLNKYLAKTEKYIMFKISDEELTEASTLFDNDIDITLSYIFAIESLINILENANIIDITTDYIQEALDDETDELNIYTIKLTSKQLREFMKLFDVFIEKAIKIIEGKTFDYDKDTEEDLVKDRNEVNEYRKDLDADDYLYLKKQIEDMQSQLEEKTKTIEKLQAEKEELNKQLLETNKIIDELSMIEKKYNILVDNIINGREIDKAFIDMLNEASDDFELKTLAKISENIKINKKTNLKLTEEDVKVIETKIEATKQKTEVYKENSLVFTALKYI